MGRVIIRTKKKSHGTMLSVYLEFCPPFTDNSGKQVRYEFLDLEKYTTPSNDAQRKFNATIDDITDAINMKALTNNFSEKEIFEEQVRTGTGRFAGITGTKKDK